MDTLMHSARTHAKPSRLKPPLRDLLGFILRYHGKHGFAPTYREMAAFAGRSTSVVYQRVERLEQLGYLTVVAEVARGIVLSGLAGQRPKQYRVEERTAGGQCVFLSEPTSQAEARAQLTQRALDYGIHQNCIAYADLGRYDRLEFRSMGGKLVATLEVKRAE